nr:MAG TPA: hypothetical protein [Bacteriophage sp.]
MFLILRIGSELELCILIFMLMMPIRMDLEYSRECIIGIILVSMEK